MTHKKDQRRLIISTSSAGDSAQVIVSDNGIGIAKENLDRIFVHGFTTKPQGHGFGLHSSVLAAQHMGGALFGHSDGPGCGATFTLTVPLQQGGA